MDVFKWSQPNIEMLFLMEFIMELFIFIKQLQYVLCPLCREPSFGHFNKDSILDVVVEDDVGDYKKRVGFDSYFLSPRSFYCQFNLDY